ncbi:Dehydrodolichyl diphosphate syntase complex subunit Dhdds [Folsomia candida]|uniref:ditrans,polycis-polyprenyl diphosphate synthase [(2E,6E)-farnesyldiphosphate specific] n=2 Tax=Folsomia candida TaxID=158441 RepID=A0A226F2L9_FOLCA|nr:Dehydrodolichyl diphosphate syntase complex subunit Dhdds [Folsomia candida]
MKPTMAKLMQDTRHGKRFRINVALAYTGRNDIARGVDTLRSAFSSKQLHPYDMSEYLLQEAWQLIPGLPVDILLRTSGETRLSDFLMWEATHAFLDFVDVQWPQLCFMDLVRAILNYQVHRKRVPVPPIRRNESDESKERVDKFLKQTRQKLWAEIMMEAKRAPENKVVK